MISQALTTKSSEYFNIGDKRFVLFNGIVQEVITLADEYYNLLEAKLASDQKAQKGLDKMNITDPVDRIYQYHDCNFSSFDENCDIAADKKLGPREFVKCIERGKCPGEGFVCQFPCNLTKRQAELTIRIGLAQGDAQIIAETFISQETLRSHKNNVEMKIGQKGKVAIGVFAAKHNLI